MINSSENDFTGENDMKRIAQLLFLCLFILALQTAPAEANSAEPPGLTILVMSPPKDLTIEMLAADGTSVKPIVLQRENKAWESYYRFFYHGIGDSFRFSDWEFKITTGGRDVIIPMPTGSMSHYNNMFTLNMKSLQLTEGQPAWRTPVLVGLRVLLTLALEGLVFYLFGYRKRQSWIVFLVVNILTQSALNLILTGPVIGNYWLYTLYFCEAIIFLIEVFAYAILLREHRKGRAIACALIANSVSLLFGGLMLKYLPM